MQIKNTSTSRHVGPVNSFPSATMDSVVSALTLYSAAWFCMAAVPVAVYYGSSSPPCHALSIQYGITV